MSDDPQSEMERSRLLREQHRLMQTQQHLERVLGGGAVDDADHEIDDFGPLEATGRSATLEMMSGGTKFKTESSPAPLTPGKSGF
jgi:hypothetical protein